MQQPDPWTASGALAGTLGDAFQDHDMALVDLLDRVLDKGIVLSGDVTITLAGVDLLYLGLQLVICSPDKRWGEPAQVTP
jgi:hypothetical protein